jgi:cysteine desulfurase
LDSVYLDNAATTRLLPEVRAAMDPFLEQEYGNPSSRHALGVRAETALDRARACLRRAVGGPGRRVVFTSGGTEANNLAVLGAARARAGRGNHVLLGPLEHASVREPAAELTRAGFEVETLVLSSGGELDLEAADARMRPDTVLVCLMLVSNEVGTILPVADLARRLRRRSPGAFLHVDAVQAIGKLEISIEDLDADSLTVSAHKVHGPKGVGALIVRDGVQLEPLIHGGGQEGGLRAGTENVGGAVGLGLATELAAGARESARTSAQRAREALVRALSEIDGVRLLQVEPAARGGRESFVPAILSVLVPGPPAEVWLHHLEERGVLAGAGSACQARKNTISPGFAALGLDAEQARHVLRFSFSRETTLEDANRAAAALTELAERLLSPRRVRS